MKLDGLILDKLVEIERQCEAELKVGSRYFLRSKALKLQLDALYKKRKNLERSRGKKLSQEESYYLELEARKAALEAACEEERNIELRIMNLATSLAFNFKEETREEIVLLRKALNAQKTRVANKLRSYINWEEKDISDVVCSPTLARPKFISTGVIESISTTEHLAEVEYKTPKDILGNDPNWDRKLATDVTIEPYYSDISGHAPTYPIELKISKEEQEQLDAPRPRVTI
jgi:hypothetical protein